MRRIRATGPRTARIMLVGEAPGKDEELRGLPFVGASGRELTRLLEEVGINRDECFVTNVCQYRPPNNVIGKWISDGVKQPDPSYRMVKDRWCHPLVVEGLDELMADIAAIRPSLIIGFGNVPLWALIGEWGITNWRGSQLVTWGGAAFIPTFHPAAILRNWSYRQYAIHDLLNRAVPSMNGPISPSLFFKTVSTTLLEVLHYLKGLTRGDLAVDIETGGGQITCIGLSHRPDQAFVIPLMTVEGPVWTTREWEQIVGELGSVACRMDVVGQNFCYDREWIWEKLEIDFRARHDTLIAQSVLYPGEPRDLGMLASLYCQHYRYWKQDAKNWFVAKTAEDYLRLWEYNARDVAATFEIARAQRSRLKLRGLEGQFAERMAYDHVMFDTMRRGVLRDPARTKVLKWDMKKATETLLREIQLQANLSLNPKSSKQVNDYFYRVLKCKPVMVKRADGKRTESTGDEALTELKGKYPQCTNIINDILYYRSLTSLESNFIKAKEDADGRLRSGFNSCGTETFRPTSGKNNFGRGCNLLNLTDGSRSSTGIALPNCKNVIVPDEGYTYFNCDLERADLQVVVWEAGDELLKEWLRLGVDVHIASAIELFGLPDAPLEELVEDHPNYLEWKGRYKKQRTFGKTFVHLTNYGGTARTAAIKCGVTIKEAESAQRKWFELHPGIRRWHLRTQAQLYATRSVRNVFGYVRTYFDRVEGCLSEALAWGPQSTIAIVTAKIHQAFELIDGVEVQVQVYDSLNGQYWTDDERRVLREMKEATRVVVPYEDPLVIPMGLSVGNSWGECNDRQWPR